ncbi:MAG: PBSX family phage terminase large subunit [Acidithiobacillus sp.]|uniref:PBSX family phage terminase large subunit n=1 Tax=Acidithiobacillus sp. TaxID=1872118 RepID=UPI003D05C3F9
MILDIQTPRIFLPLLEPARYKGVYGGRGSGKSHFFAELLIERCIAEKIDAVCLREVQRTLDESVKKLLEDKIQSLGVGHLFTVQHNRILTPHDGRIIFVGMQDQNAQNIKSLEGFDIAWFEEAQTMSARSLELLRPTIRKPGSELWFSWNPDNEGDAIDQFLRGPSRPPESIVIEANWRDNPWFPEELEAERRLDYEVFPGRYRHIWEGDYGIDGDTFFPMEKLLVDGQPVTIDWRPDYLFAVIDTANKDGAKHDGTACAIWAKSRDPFIPLVLVDWDVVQIKASLLMDWLPGIEAQLEALADELKPRHGNVGIWIEDAASGIQLLQTAEAQGRNVHAIDSKLTSAGKEGRAIACSPYIARDQVKISRHAYDKTVKYRGQTKNHLWDQVSRFAMGQDKKDHMKDALDVFMYGPLIALGNTDGY